MSNETTLPRIFKIGATTIIEDDTMTDLSNEQVRDLLKRTYPEVAHATIREREHEGQRVIDLLPRAGKKG